MLVKAATGRRNSNFSNVILNSSDRSIPWVFPRQLPSCDCYMTSVMINQHLVQRMACYRQATMHYLSQCLPRSVLPYDFTSPQ